MMRARDLRKSAQIRTGMRRMSIDAPERPPIEKPVGSLKVHFARSVGTASDIVDDD